MRKIFAPILALLISAGACAGQGAAPAAPANADEVIDQVLAINGIKRTLQRLPAQLASGLVQSPASEGASAEEQQQLAKTVADAFPKDVFLNHVSAALKKRYDRARYAHYLQLFSTPLAQRITELEARDPSRTEVQGFLALVAKQPLSPARIKLVQRIDEAGQSSALMTQVAMASIEAGAMAAADGCGKAMEQVRQAVAKTRPALEARMRSNVQVMLAFTYRDLTDSELDSYAQAYEDKDARWVMDLVQAALVEQFQVSMRQALRGMNPIVLAHKPKKTMFAPKCGQSASPAEERAMAAQAKAERNPPRGAEAQQAAAEPAAKAPQPEVAAAEAKPAAPEAKPRVAEKQAAPAAASQEPNKEPVTRLAALEKPAAKAHHYPARDRDLRDCLQLASSAAVIACAEK